MNNDRLVSYAKMIALNHPEEYEEVKRRIDAKMLERFRRGDKETREAIANIMNADEIFMSELRLIIANDIKPD